MMRDANMTTNYGMNRIRVEFHFVQSSNSLSYLHCQRRWPHSIAPTPAYRQALETLVERELGDGSQEEYWELQEGRVGSFRQGGMCTSGMW